MTFYRKMSVVTFCPVTFCPTFDGNIHTNNVHIQHLQGLINLFLVKGNVSFFQTDEKHGSSGTCTSFIYRLDIHFQ